MRMANYGIIIIIKKNSKLHNNICLKTNSLYSSGISKKKKKILIFKWSSRKRQDSLCLAKGQPTPLAIQFASLNDKVTMEKVVRTLMLILS